MTINFDRASKLMDVVQKVASVAPTYTALSALAMMELKEMNEEAQKHLNELGQQRLKEEQAAAAKLNEHNRIAAEKQARIDKEIAERTAASNAVKPITVMPGEPVPNAVRAQAGEPLPDPTPHETEDRIPETETPQFLDDPAPVTRRV